MLETDLIKTKKFCSKGCGGRIHIEKCSDGESRWKIIFCENWCWQVTSDKKKIVPTNTFAEYKMVDGKSYMRSNRHPEFAEVYLSKSEKGHLKVKFYKSLKQGTIWK